MSSTATSTAKRQLAAASREHVHSVNAYRGWSDDGIPGPWKCAECRQPFPADVQRTLNERWRGLTVGGLHDTDRASRPMPSDA